MVLEHYNLREQPFGVTPDSRYLYSSATHREALASLLYGLQSGRGFVALIAKPGMGKTTLLFQLLSQIKDSARVVFLFQTMCTPLDFLRAVLTDLGVQETQGSLIDLQSKLNEVVTEQSRSGKPLVIVIDEAQNLDDSVLEMVRMLSNFETEQQKLVQIVLSGQPQLADRLSMPNLVQLRQRVSIVACLEFFPPEETAHYITHRMTIAGYAPESSLFTSDAIALISEYSRGIPRNINNLCFNALSLGCALKRTTIDCDIVREVVSDLDLEPLRERPSIVLQPEKQNAPQTVPAFASIASVPSLPTAWLPRFVIACAILLALGGAAFQSHRWLMPKTVVKANRVVRLPIAAPSPLFRVEQPSPVAPVNTIHVIAGQSLYRICVNNFGSCSSERLQQIHRLNPWLINLDHIESGQKIRLPVARELSAVPQRSVERPGNASLAERGKP